MGKVNMDHESTAITTHQSVEETRKSVAIELCTVMIYDYFITIISCKMEVNIIVTHALLFHSFIEFVRGMKVHVKYAQF